ncbi:MAG: efflux RND transporter periplasmic adaptor subunit [Gallionella sp.]
MKNISTKFIIGAIAILSVGASGYWLGTRSSPAPVTATSATTAKAEPKILYYRNAMGLPDTSPVPKKDSMGMDYVPVFEGGADAGDGKQVTMSVEKVQKLGVKSEAATLRALDKTIRAVGRIEVNERRTYTIAPKFEGWVERLDVNTSGQLVSKGQPLFDVYSPELISALREYALARQGELSLKDAGDDAPGYSAKASMKQLAAASFTRLKNWGIGDEQIREFENNKDKRSVTFYAPVSGIVLEKKAVQGMRFMPGEMLFQVADLSTVWVVAEVAEQDIGAVKAGSVAHVNMAAYPDKHFEGRIDFVYPTLNPATRTVQIRLEMSNPQGLLKPAMFAQVEVPVTGKGKVITVPISAVIDSGTRQIVLVQLAEGRFEPREVKLGSRSDNYMEVLNGVAAGEQVVVSANFLIDAESNLQAALGGLVHARGGETPDAKDTAQPAAEHAEHGAAAKQAKSAVVGHQAQGTLDAINADGTVSITHGPITSLGWPGMTMDFALANSSLASSIKIGSTITFELVERKPGEYVITKLQAKPRTSHEEH